MARKNDDDKSSGLSVAQRADGAGRTAPVHSDGHISNELLPVALLARAALQPAMGGPVHLAVHRQRAWRLCEGEELASAGRGLYPS